MTEQEMIDWIDNATSKQLVARWKNEKVGHPIFSGIVGDHYVKVMKEKFNFTSETLGHLTLHTFENNK
jgi:hypothetical protein